MQKIYKDIYNLKSQFNCNIVFDTRLIKENDIFIGLKTKKNNGSLYYKEALKKKASLIIVNIKNSNPKIVYVKDTQLLIKNLCKIIIESYKGKIIAITGSVGKTTFKENIFYILKKNKFITYRSYKNYNNLQGLQFSIMNMKLDSNYSIFELGINHPNEMINLVKTLQPHYCLVTGIENSHIGNFRNFKELINNKLKIFNSKRLLYGFINFNYKPHYVQSKLNNKIQLINIENLNKNIKKIKNKYSVDFSLDDRKYSILSVKGSFYINIAIISFLFLKLFIKKFDTKIFFYEESIIESRGKEVITNIRKKKVKFFDHSYNASPYSLNKQILIFNERKITKKLLILGAMKELGAHKDYYHKQIIQLVTDLNLKKIIFIGEEFYKFKNKFINFKFYKNYLPAIKHLNKDIENINNIFVMGSRSNYLDRIIKKYVK